MRVENIFSCSVSVALLDQQPILFVLRVAIATAARMHERERAVELEAVQVDIDFALADRVGGVSRRIDDLINAAIPHDAGAGAVISRWNDALEVAVFQRMVLDGDGKMLVGGIHRRAFRNRPRAQDAFHLESKIVVEASRGMLLNDESGASGGT